MSRLSRSAAEVTRPLKLSTLHSNTGPEARKWRKAWEKEQDRKSAAQRAAEEHAAVLAAQTLVAEVAKAQAAGVTVDEDGEAVEFMLTTTCHNTATSTRG